MTTLGLLFSAASGHGEQARILVALAFVLVGAKLMGALVERVGQPAVLDGKPVVSPETYAAAVFMVVVTTMATPPLLLWSLKRDGAGAAGPLVQSRAVQSTR